MQTTKHAAWKKNRKLGDVYGGRTVPKLADRVFNRQHNLSVPDKGTQLPIYITDNPSRDFYFPVSTEQIKAALAALPAEQTKHLTHIWLQKVKKSAYLSHDTFQGAFICGGGVNLIILHPFPKDNKMRLGKEKPLRKILNYYKEFPAELKEDRSGWYLQWTEESICKYHIERLLLHEIGHSIDSYHKRYWSKAAKVKSENYADNYAAVWADMVRGSFSPNLSKSI